MLYKAVGRKPNRVLTGTQCVKYGSNTCASVLVAYQTCQNLRLHYRSRYSVYLYKYRTVLLVGIYLLVFDDLKSL